MTNELNTSENLISKFFDKESKNMADRHQEKGLPDSAQIHIENILERTPESVLDVGSGPGTVLLKFLDHDVPEVVGIDLSPGMNEIARDQIESNGYSNRAKIIEGSFVKEPLDKIDAISLHRVLCCYPDKDAMIDKSVSLEPRVISITLLRDWKILNILVKIFGTVANWLSSFRPYVHSQSAIDKQLLGQGYEINNQAKSLFWTTTTYIKSG